MPNNREVAISDWTLEDLNPLDRITANFQVYELLRSDTASRRNIPNVFARISHLHNAIYLTRSILQPLRDEFGPFRPNSVYRSQDLDRAVKSKPEGWRSISQHTRGEAADVEIATISNFDLATWIKDSLEFDQLILECYDPVMGPNSGWVHVSRKEAGNRGDVKTYSRDAKTGKFQYYAGLLV